MVIDTVMFDYGGVIADHYSEPYQTMMAKALGTTHQGIKDLTAEGSIHGRLYRLGQMTMTEFWSAVRELSPNKAFDEQVVQDLWAKTYIINQSMLSLLLYLKNDLGVQTGMVTNEDRIRFQYIKDNHDLDKYLCLTVASFEVGSIKPEKKMYEAILRLCGRHSNPERVLYVDDRITHAEAARSLGMNAIVFENPGKLTSFLDSIHITRF